MQHTRMITYPALFFSHCPLLFSAISIHIGFKSVITIAYSHQFSLPKDLLKWNYSAVLHTHSSNEQTHSAGDGLVDMALVYFVVVDVLYGFNVFSVVSIRLRRCLTPSYHSSYLFVFHTNDVG
jgi:hypothetical protein